MDELQGKYFSPFTCWWPGLHLMPIGYIRSRDHISLGDREDVRALPLLARVKRFWDQASDWTIFFEFPVGWLEVGGGVKILRHQCSIQGEWMTTRGRERKAFAILQFSSPVPILPLSALIFSLTLTFPVFFL